MALYRLALKLPVKSLVFDRAPGRNKFHLPSAVFEPRFRPEKSQNLPPVCARLQ
jgi:hypothetical protein